MSAHKSIIFFILFIVVVLGGGYWFHSHGYIHFGKPDKAVPQTEGQAALPGHDHSQAGSSAAKAGERKILYWVDPMHPAYKSDKPGTAPDCGMDLMPVYADGGGAWGSQAANMPGMVKISSAKQQLIGVQIGQVHYGSLSRTIRAVGQLSYDETKITRIHTKIAGWIDKVFVDYTGQLVKKGQPLFSIYSPDLVSTEEEFLIGLKAKEYLGDNRFKEVSTGALSLYQAARQRLQRWDISDAQIQELERTQKPLRDLTLYAPYDGFVTKRNAFPKQQVTPDTEVYELADLSTVWVNARVFEYELPEIRLGQSAKVTLSYENTGAYYGKVSYIYPQLDNATRTAKVRVDLPNPDFKLRPDMYANIEFTVNYGKQVSIPSQAVLDSGKEQIVFVVQGEGYFEPRKVRLGDRLGDQVIVLQGLKAGEPIVTSGNFLIDSESQLKSALGGMTGMPGMEGNK